MFCEYTPFESYMYTYICTRVSIFAEDQPQGDLHHLQQLDEKRTAMKENA